MHASLSTRTLHNLLLVCIVAAASLVACRPAMAQSIWTNPASSNWNNNGNWSTALFPNAADVDAVFNAANPAANSTITLGVPVTVGTIQINNPTTSTITGQSITFNDSNSAEIQFNSGNWTIASDIILDSNLTVTGSSNGTITGIISDGTATNLTKSGTGVLTLGGVNTLTGNVNVTNGVLVLDNAGGEILDSVSQLNLSGNGMVRLGATERIDNAAALVMSGNSTFDLDGFTERIASLSGSSNTSISVDGGYFVVDGSSNTTYSGTINGGGTFEHAGSGTLTLNGANPFSGNTIVSDGILRLSAANALGATGGVKVSGDGILRLAASETINNSAGVSLSNTANFDLDGNTETIGTLNGSASTTVTLGNGHLEVKDNANSTFDGVISGSGSFAKTGTFTMQLGGANTFTGSTRIDDGTLRLNAVNALGSTSGVTLNGDAILQQNAAGSVINNSAPVVLNDTSRLDLNGNNEVIGSLAGDAGTTVTLGAGNLTTGGNGNSTAYNGIISGTGGLTKTGGGTFSLNGANIYTGPTAINNGRLDVNGSVTSAVTANNGGTFGGTGSAPKVTINNGGTIAPGNSIGTMTINGAGTPAYTQATGGNYQAEINNAGAMSGDVAVPVTTPGVNNDLIDLTNAAATVSLAGNVNVVDTTGGSFYQPGTTYTILKTANPLGVLGQSYDTVTDNLAIRDAQLIHNLNSVQVRLVRIDGNFEANGLTRNQMHVGKVLDDVNALATGDLGVVLDQMVQLAPNQIPAVLDQLGGEIHASVAGNIVQTSSQFVDMVSRRLRANSSGPIGMYGSTVAPGAPMLLGSTTADDLQRVSLTDAGDFVVRAQGLGAPGYGSAYGFGGVGAYPSLGSLWAGGYGLSGSVDGDGNGNPFNYKSFGTAFGIEQTFTPDLLMGLVGGYSHSKVDMSKPNSDADVDSYHAGLYGHLTEGIAYSTLLASYGYQSYDSSRRIMIPGPMPITRTANGSTHGNELVAYGEKGLNLIFGGLLVQPLVGLQYIALTRNAFTETGAGALNLKVNKDHVNSLRMSAGGRIAPALPDGFFGAIIPEFRGRWVHEFLDDDQTLSASFAGAPGNNFAVTGAQLGRNFGVVGAGLNAQLSPMVNLYLDYDFTFSSALQSHAGSGGLEFLW